MPKHNAASVRSQASIHLADNTVAALSAMNDMWTRVDAARAKALPSSVRPADSFTADEYAAKFGMLREEARGQLRRLADAGIFKKHRIIDIGADSRRCVMNVYTVAK